MAEVREKIRTDYTEGPIVGSILKMGLPSMFGFLSQQLYALADMYWVSNLDNGEAAVAAITFFNNIMWLFFSFNQLVGPGSVAVISRRYGEKLFDSAEKAIKESILLKLVIGLALGISGYIFIDKMMVLVGAENDALAMGIRYGKIMFIFLPVLYATYTIYTALRGVANPNMALVLMLASNALNMILDPLCIFGYGIFPAWGIVGAAYATVFSFSLIFTVGLLIFYRDKTNVKLNLFGAESIQLSSMLKMIKIGIPAWLGDLSFSGSRLVIVPMIATFGTSVVAAYGIGTQITALGVMVMVGIGLGLSSLIGHNIGSGKIERAKKTADIAIIMGMSIMVVIALAALVLPKFIMGLFFDNAETIAHGVELLRIFAIGFPFIGAFIMLEQIHLGVGLNTPSMVMVIIHSWFLQVLPIVLFVKVFNFDQTAVWWVFAFAITVSSVIFYLYYRRGRWLTVKV